MGSVAAPASVGSVPEAADVGRGDVLFAVLVRESYCVIGGEGRDGKGRGGRVEDIWEGEGRDEKIGNTTRSVR